MMNLWCMISSYCDEFVVHQYHVYNYYVLPISYLSYVLSTYYVF